VITLVLGGAGSGKSGAAERLARRLPDPVTYVSTWVPTDHDPEMAVRVAAHRARRPAAWGLREAGPELARIVRDVRGTVLVDSLGPWVAGCDGFEADVRGLCSALRERAGDAVVVSDEVGLGVHPSTASGRRFRDALGAVNQAVAEVADSVWLVVAGRVLVLDARVDP
jgi:adenosyl cobinamide kinase/adenosyl cobinamide phosphate guanylyltransferase